MYNNYEIHSGKPFTGAEKEKLVAFLKEQDLTYDEGITYSVTIEDQGKIIASGSCQGNILKCIAVAPNYQGQNLMGNLMTMLVECLVKNGITHYFGFTKPKNKKVFSGAGLYPIAETNEVLLLENRRAGFKNYLKKLQQETEEQLKNGRKCKEGNKIIGAVVANCNPFTEGHRYLIRQAARDCKLLHLFILSQEQEFMSAEDRFELVREGVADIPNVILHRTSDYLISPVVFPTYFIKEKARAFDINCMLDIEIFRKHIAKTLQIDRRYVGSEPDCQVTRHYNECLKTYLPEAEISVVELSRLTTGKEVVSASKVRQACQSGKMETVKDMVPESTWEYLNRRFVEEAV